MTTVNEEAATPSSGPPSTAHVVGDMCMMFVSHGINLEEHLMEAQQSASRLGFQLRMARKTIQEGEHALDRQDKELRTLRALLGEAVGLLERAVSGADDQAGRSAWGHDVTDLVVRWHATLPMVERDCRQMPVPVDTGVDPTASWKGNTVPWSGPTCGPVCEHAPDGTGRLPCAPSAGPDVHTLPSEG